MIQFNLLPDVKAQYLKAQRLKRVVYIAAFLISGASLLVLIMLILIVDVDQKNQLSVLNKNIQSSSNQLSSDKNLNDILTIQNQLTTLSQLETQNPSAVNLLNYLSELTPTSASISSIEVNFNLNTFSITGSANSLDTVNEYVDTIKYATYSTGSNKTYKKAFSSVVLTTFGYSGNSSNGQPANYTINFNFDPTIFDSNQKINLKVPHETTTRSLGSVPNNLFVKAITKTTNGLGH